MPFDLAIAVSVNPANVAKVLATLGGVARTLQLPRRDRRVGLVLEAEDSRRALPGFPGLLAFAQGTFHSVGIWDRDFQTAIRHLWPELPFPDRFSYGDVPNKARVVADIGRFELVLRLDAGTTPPAEFSALIGELAGHLASGKSAISTYYTSRNTLRNFRAGEPPESYVRLIEEYTAIDPRWGKEPAAGAAFLMARECGPAPMFDRGGLVFAVDDAFFKRLYGADQVGVLPHLRRDQQHRLIERAEPGYGMSPTEYAGRLASGVVFREAMIGSPRARAAARAREFIGELNRVFPEAGIDPALDPKTGVVFDGYQCWRQLRDQWPSVCAKLVALNQTLPEEVRCCAG
jgi:hypothetical protein